LMTEFTPSFNSIRLDSDDFNGSFQSNFALKDLGATVKERLRYYVQGATGPTENLLTKRLDFDLQMEQPEPLRWLGLDIKKLSGLRVTGGLVPTHGNLDITMELQQLVWSDISLNDVDMGVQVSNENALANLTISSVHYDTVKMGALHYNLISQENALRSRFSFRKDSVTILDLQGSATRQQDRFYFVIDSLLAFNRPIQVSSGHAILFNDQSISFEDLEIRDKDFAAYLSGNENQFELSWVNGNLHHIHDVWGKYWMEDIHGFLNGEVHLDRQLEVLEVTLEVDSLSVNSSHPAQVHLSAHKAGSAVPFNLRLNSQSNLIDFSGSYSPFNKAIKATVDVDVRELEQMQYLFDTYLEELRGSVRGNVSIAGTLDNPETKGSFNLKQVNLGVRNPRAQLQIENQSLVFNGSEIIFDQFTIRDQLKNKLVVNGKINPGLKQAPSYSLNIFSDNFVLFDTPPAEDRPLHGKLVLGTDFLLSGQDRDINIKGSLTIKDSTAVTYVTAPEDIVLTTGEGIVTFVDPHADPDTLKLDLSSSLYDSLVANLPDFNLETNLTIEPEAAFKVVIDPQSGDYIELSGAADMEFAFDRTGNVQLSGVYNLSRGTYQLSFYDIVSKKFELSPGSTVTWNGNPLSGKLNIAAINSIKTSSIGLVGNEIGEGEKALYRKPLDYLVGINIRGSIEYPEISFSMDLSKNDRSNYPVLANKLDRLNQPEFEAELNRQVFGLLVLGGFLPENTRSNINTGVMATTALANSVNSILANQLNQITNRYIKGVDIDIGLESYSDYTSGGGQTRTAMEFRVSKTLANDRLSIEAGGSFDLDSDQSGTSRGDGYKGDIAIIYDLTATGNKKLKLFNNETYDIIYHEVRNTGISLIFVREFDKRQKKQ
ncbi:MAG: translocation/assembly module TamB, partial [Cyclobacteriaceae bacterium]|nr:translocation/assembly module TamB [Cyclobacteriaceae bacterium]